MAGEDRTVRELLDEGTVVSLVTSDCRGRPMSVAEVDGSTVWFLTSASAEWVRGLQTSALVGLVRSDDDAAVWASLVGAARTTADDERRQALWSPVVSAWFEGPEDPDLVALAVDVTEGEWWDAPSSVVARGVKMVAAAISDEAEVGDQGSVATS